MTRLFALLSLTTALASPAVAEMLDVEKDELTFGFIKLTDMAPLAVAYEKGYFEDEAQTREAIDEDGWLHTGDIGVMSPEGNLRITDRVKDMFIMGGFNCYPAEIEGMLFSHPSVGQVAVIGVPDDRMGEVGMAFIVPAPGTSPTQEEIIGWSRNNMANYKVPRYVEVMDALPMNASGKVQKFILREHMERGSWIFR